MGPRFPTSFGRTVSAAERARFRQQNLKVQTDAIL